MEQTDLLVPRGKSGAIGAGYAPKVTARAGVLARSHGYWLSQADGNHETLALPC